MSVSDGPSEDRPGRDGPIDPWKPVDVPPIEEPAGPVYFPLDQTAQAPAPEREPIIPPGSPFVAASQPGPQPGPMFVRLGETPEQRLAEQASLVDPDFNGRPWPWFVGPLALLVALIGVTILSVLVVILIAALSSGDPSTTEITDDYEHWFGLGQDALWILVALAIPVLFTRYLRPGQLGLRRPPKWWRAIWVFVAAFFFFYLSALAYASLFHLDDQSNSLLDTDSGFGNSVVRDVAFALLYTVAAPVAEELLFRGLLFRTIRDGFRRRFGRGAPWVAALISGVIFGGIHYSPAAANQNNFLPVLMALGFLLALAYNFSGTIYVNILLHSVNNAIATGSNTTPTHDWVYVLIGIGPILAMLATFLLSRVVGAVFPADPKYSAHPPSAGPAIV